jgi:hypothetical protein
MEDAAEADKALDEFAASLGVGKQSGHKESSSNVTSNSWRGHACSTEADVPPMAELVPRWQKAPRAWARAFASVFPPLFIDGKGVMLGNILAGKPFLMKEVSQRKGRSLLLSGRTGCQTVARSN